MPGSKRVRYCGNDRGEDVRGMYTDAADAICSVDCATLAVQRFCFAYSCQSELHRVGQFLQFLCGCHPRDPRRIDRSYPTRPGWHLGISPRTHPMHHQPRLLSVCLESDRIPRGMAVGRGLATLRRYSRSQRALHRSRNAQSYVETG